MAAACRSFQLLPFIFSVLICSFAQDLREYPTKTSSPSPESVLLKEVSTVPVPSLPAKA